MRLKIEEFVKPPFIIEDYFIDLRESKKVSFQSAGLEKVAKRHRIRRSRDYSGDVFTAPGDVVNVWRDVVLNGEDVYDVAKKYFLSPYLIYSILKKESHQSWVDELEKTHGKKWESKGFWGNEKRNQSKRVA